MLERSISSFTLPLQKGQLLWLICLFTPLFRSYFPCNYIYWFWFLASSWKIWYFVDALFYCSKDDRRLMVGTPYLTFKSPVCDHVIDLSFCVCSQRGNSSFSSLLWSWCLFCWSIYVISVIF